MQKTHLAGERQKTAVPKVLRYSFLILSAYLCLVIPEAGASFIVPPIRTPSTPGDGPSRQARIQEIATSIASAEFASAEYLGGDFQNSIRLSPDGRWVAYIVSTASVLKNVRQESYRIRKADGSGGEIPLPSNAANPQFSPDGSMLALMQPNSNSSLGSIVIYSFHDGELHEIRRLPITSKFIGPFDNPAPSVSQAWSYKWSPDSKTIALNVITSGDDSRIPADHGITEEEWRANGGAHYELRLYNVTNNAMRRVDLHGLLLAASDAGFDWSPNSRQLAIVISRDPNDENKNCALAIYDAIRGSTRVVADRAGFNGRPIWSPTGTQILFESQGGAVDHSDGRPAVLDLPSGKVRYHPELARGHPVHWADDGKSFIWSFKDKMHESLVQIGMQSQTVVSVAAADGDGMLYDDNSWSFSADGKSVAFARSSFVSPPDLYIAEFNSASAQLSGLHRLTRFAERLNFADRVHVEDVSWPSRDGLFTIHGLLAMPARKATTPLPTVLFLTGGPAMVRRQFDATGTGVRLAFAAVGYAVLVPNTRGREGYGDDFLNGIRNGHSYSRLPLNDALDGLDMLVHKHISDPQKLVIAGHSYGGYLAEYAITQTRMFKAAIVLEGHRTDLTTFLYAPYYQEREEQLYSKYLYGFENPYSPPEKQRLLEESPGFNADRVATPTLLVFGGHARSVGEELYAQYRHFRVPTELLVYREDHVFQKPANVADSMAREIEWSDHWLAKVD